MPNYPTTQDGAVTRRSQVIMMGGGDTHRTAAHHNVANTRLPKQYGSLGGHIYYGVSWPLYDLLRHRRQAADHRLGTHLEQRAADLLGDLLMHLLYRSSRFPCLRAGKLSCRACDTAFPEITTGPISTSYHRWGTLGNTATAIEISIVKGSTR